MNVLANFVSEYANTLLYAILTGIAGYIGACAKKLYTARMNEKKKKDTVRICVQAVEQIYKDLHGKEKYDEVVKAAYEMLSQYGISVTDLELKMLIEAAVAEFNRVFDSYVPMPDV